jgi:hypothetical protein
MVEHSSQITYVPTPGSPWGQEPVYFEHYTPVAGAMSGTINWITVE